MNEFDIPIFKKSYDLYKTFHEYRRLIPKKDRYTTFERAEHVFLDVLSGIFTASSQAKRAKLSTLQEVSVNLNLFRILISLLKDTKALDNKKYLKIQSEIDEIGRMLGGWLRSLKTAD